MTGNKSYNRRTLQAYARLLPGELEWGDMG